MRLHGGIVAAPFIPVADEDMADGKLNRCPWETDFQWNARKRFIETWINDFPEDHLAAVSMVWSNMKFLGCKYPSETGELVQELESKAALDVIPVKTSRTPEPLVPSLTIYEPAENETTANAISILNESAQKSKQNILFEELGCNLNHEGLFIFSCAVSISNKLIATATGNCKKDAKRNTADKALKILRSCQPIRKKLIPSHDAKPDIDRSDLVRKAYVESPKISEDNIGNQMLRKMGWKGSGGVGKEEQGREAPVMLSGKEGKFGLGIDAAAGAVVSRGSVKEALMKFIADHTQTDIKFSSELTKEDRALVHRVSQQYGLKHRSYGKGEDRYLVVGKM